MARVGPAEWAYKTMQLPCLCGLLHSGGIYTQACQNGDYRKLTSVKLLIQCSQCLIRLQTRGRRDSSYLEFESYFNGQEDDTGSSHKARCEVSRCSKAGTKKAGDKFRLTGLGILEVKDWPARAGRNAATGETIQIAASKKIAFRPAKELKDAT